MQSSWIAEKWLYDVLANDVTLMADMVDGVHVDSVPRDAERYVLITNADLDDVSYVGARIGWGTTLYAVRAVAEVLSYEDVLAASERIHTLLHRQRGSTDAGVVLSCHRDQPFRMLERRGDREWRHLGGIYRILVREP